MQGLLFALRLKKEKGLATAKVADPKNKGPSHTPLHTAVKARALPMVEALLAAGADANAVDANGATPLHWMLGGQRLGLRATLSALNCPCDVLLQEVTCVTCAGA
eukprot:366568-Chlamydomonas_euryale.AAC.18